MFQLNISYSDIKGTVHNRNFKCPDMDVVIAWIKFYQRNEVIIKLRVQWLEKERG